MEIKKIEPVNVFYKQVETTLKEIGNYVGNTPAAVAEEAAKKGFKITGPQIWNYIGVDGNPDTMFKIDICFPIDAPVNSHNNDIKVLDGFNAACSVLKGPWNELGSAYKVLMDEMNKEGLQNSSVNREIYHLCDFNDQQNCITEIQVGIQ